MSLNSVTYVLARGLVICGITPHLGILPSVCNSSVYFMCILTLLLVALTCFLSGSGLIVDEYYFITKYFHMLWQMNDEGMYICTWLYLMTSWPACYKSTKKIRIWDKRSETLPRRRQSRAWRGDRRTQGRSRRIGCRSRRPSSGPCKRYSLGRNVPARKIVLCHQHDI